MEEQKKPLRLCSQCMHVGSSGNTQMCAGCRVERYCSAECQKAHWPMHREKCKKIQQDRLTENRTETLQQLTKSIFTLIQWTYGDGEKAKKDKRCVILLDFLLRANSAKQITHIVFTGAFDKEKDDAVELLLNGCTGREPRVNFRMLSFDVAQRLDLVSERNWNELLKSSMPIIVTICVSGSNQTLSSAVCMAERKDYEKI